VNISSCDEYITQPVNMGYYDHPFVGSFLPGGPTGDKINLTRYGYDSVGPYFVFLNIHIDPTLNFANFNDSAQESFFRLYVYESSMFLYN